MVRTLYRSPGLETVKMENVPVRTITISMLELPGEAVSDARFGEDQARAGWILLEFLP